MRIRDTKLFQKRGDGSPFLLTGEAMPLYIYVCEACGAEEEILRRVEERDQPIDHEHNTSLFPGDEVLIKTYPMTRKLTTHQSYTIKGSNDSSVTPKKFRSEK